MKKKNLYIVGAGLLFFIIITIALTLLIKERPQKPIQYPSEEIAQYYTCGMHPSVKVSVEEFEKGSIFCPICNMKLIPVYEEKAQRNPSPCQTGLHRSGSQALIGQRGYRHFERYVVVAVIPCVVTQQCSNVRCRA